ncbi:caspase family protein [Streptomyces sp. NPDC048270]|uniref:caspase family protein n=1 Tax=Streptomyces sp. NPDC048270 TaxID=3154615 RepID=UPI0033DF7F63
MTMRALLIGAQTYDLTGVNEDMAVMERLLADRGFADLRLCAEGETTYHGMVEALAKLACETKPGDAVVVYYAGHGALLPVPAALRERFPGGPAYLQYLVPSDHRDSTASDFRGYLAEELTLLLRRLTRTTPNVTCILDCCHSGGMVRDAGRRRIRSVRSGVIAEAGLERALRLATAPRLPDPDVVRLVACQRHGVAYENEHEGLFTAALAKVLDDFRHTAVPWATLIPRIRDEVQLTEVLQRPDAGGPSGRLPFSLDVPALPERLPLRAAGGALRVVGGALYGLRALDVVRLVLPAEEERSPDTVMEVAVAAVDAADALLDPSFNAPAPPLPLGSYALPVRVHKRHPVRIAAGGPLAEAIRTRLASSPRLIEADRESEPLSYVRVREGKLETTDATGLSYRHPDELSDPMGDPSAPARKAIALLETIARGERMRGLGDPGADGLLRQDLRAWMEVETEPGSHAFREFRTCDGMRAGDRYRISVTGASTTALYVWLLGVGLSGRISLVTHDQPSGIRLEPVAGHDEKVGWRSGPVEVWWPDDVPARGRRPESVLLLVGDDQLDLSPLGGGTRRRWSEPDALRVLLDEVCEGVRDSRVELHAKKLRYRVFSWHTTVEPPVIVKHGRHPGSTGDARSGE